MEQILITTEFAKDVDLGLSASPKFLKSKYFYDANGTKIFQDIMKMPEYYLTNCEEEIFQLQKKQLFESFTNAQNHFEIVELGAGDGKKTRILLEYFLEQGSKIKYIPIDISEEAIVQLSARMIRDIPGLDLEGKVGDYFHLMEEISNYDKTDKVLFFLGSNIGNFTEKESIGFLRHLRAVMNPGDKLFTGFDLKKDPEVILKAYNDPHGYTASFNLNLLRRINEELGADFELLKFMHKEVYDPVTGAAKSYLVSRENQTVTIRGLKKAYRFEKWEPVYMERSQKYDLTMIEHLAEKSGFAVVRNFTDSRQYFMNSLWKVVQK
jgi:dimethylhistidine N-methyltransferase